MTVFLAIPVQSQTPPRLTNPTSVSACGLPTTWAQFNDSATVTTFNMTADCTFSSGNVQNNLAFLYFTAGEFTINGNGHSIIGPTNGYAIYVDNAGTVLNLNDVTIRQAGNSIVSSIQARNGRINARNIIFRDSTANIIVVVSGAGQIHLENVQFLSNRGAGGSPQVVHAGGYGSLIHITNSIFQGNTGFESMIDSLTAVQLHGCITLANNEGSRYSARSTGITDSAPGKCPPGFRPPKKKKKEVPTAAPTSTPRPQIAATHVALQAATGATFRTSYGLDSGVHFRQLDGAGIGVQSIIDAGPLEALDVYGYVEQGVEVCFPQVGRVLFLDARTMPRAIVPLDATVRAGMTCVFLDSPGSLVLMPPP